MVKAFAVIGANFGDEAKGAITDYLCSTKDIDTVVRYNGGAQAAHTVVLPTGQRHVFSHYGSGSFCGVKTYLSQFFVCNPIKFFEERDKLEALGIGGARVFAHPQCLVTTFADMIINQRKENQRGSKRHGSVGLGFAETINRSELPHLKITMADLWNGVNLEPILDEICNKYAHWRTTSVIEDPDAMIEAFIKGCEAFADAVAPMGMEGVGTPLFEGAQGLLLDQNNKEFFPHLTRSNTGMKNVRTLLDHADIEQGAIETYYVSRTYLTRHGAGPLPGEDKGLRYEELTNKTNHFQGAFRFAPLDTGLIDRCRADFGNDDFKIAMTHQDQCPTTKIWDGLSSTGPTRYDVEEI